MLTFAKLTQQLEDNDIPFEVGDGFLIVEKSGAEGFDVAIFEEAEGFVVMFNDWPQYFITLGGAMRRAQAGLSTQCRVHEWRKGGVPFKWLGETLDEPQGHEFGTLTKRVLRNLLFWRRSNVVRLHNDYFAQVPWAEI